MKWKQILFKLFWWTYLKQPKDNDLCSTCVFGRELNGDCLKLEHIAQKVRCKYGFRKRFEFFRKYSTLIKQLLIIFISGIAFVTMIWGSMIVYSIIIGLIK